MRSQSSMNEKALRPSSTSPMIVNPTSSEPSVENIPRISSPKSEPTFPPASIAPNAIASGHITCTSEAATMPTIRSPAMRKPTGPTG